MDANDRGRWACRLLLVATMAIVACSGTTPTGPSNPTPTPAPTVQTCTAGQPLTSFTAGPTTFTDGETFTLSWTAPCGFVSLALTGQAPFAVLQPSIGSYQLKPGLTGYPAAVGDTVYEAKNGDTATPRSATVTMRSAGPPTVNVSTSPSSCHPQKWNSQPCSVTCTANASSPSGDTLSYQWSGCASGTGSTGTCTFNQPGNPGTCTVTVTDSKGKGVTGSQTVQSTNVMSGAAVVDWLCQDGRRYPQPQHSQWCNVTLNVADDDPDPSHAVTVVPSTMPGCPINSSAWANSHQYYISLNINQAAGTWCNTGITLTDDWGLSAYWAIPNVVQ
jgi:hypothetical protein